MFNQHYKRALFPLSVPTLRKITSPNFVVDSRLNFPSSDIISDVVSARVSLTACFLLTFPFPVGEKEEEMSYYGSGQSLE